MSEESRDELLWQARKEGDFFIAYLGTAVFTGDRLDELPDHVTLYPRFRTMGARAIVGFQDALRDSEAICAHVGDRVFGRKEHFGDSNDTAVRTIDNESALSLMAIHMLFLARFRPYTYDLQWSGQRYRPHMTINGEFRDPGKGSTINIDSACLILKPEDSKSNYVIYSADEFGNEE